MRARRVGSWELLEELARGGAGTVWRARDAQGREAALKLLHEGAGANEARQRRLMRELGALTRLAHPHVVRALDGGVTLEGMPFLALELVPGESLQERLQREGTLPVREAVAIARKLAEALDHAHASGVLHRDVKPDNVLLRPDGEPVLTDFGLMRELEPGEASVILTVEGRPLGTPGYWAPEQARGDAERIGPASDLYGLGATLYALLTGAPPHGFPASVPEALLASDRPVVPPSARRNEVDAALDRIVLGCLERDPERRPRDAARLAAELRAWERPGRRATARLRPAGRRLPIRAALLSLLLLLGGVGGAGALLHRGAQRDARARAAGLGRQAGELVRRGDIPGAVEACGRALALDPDSPPAVAADAYLTLVREDWPGAQARAERALALDPGSADALAVRACARLRRGDARGAQEDCARALELGPDRPLVHNVRGIVLGECRPDEAGRRASLEAYDRAASLDPGYVWAIVNRAVARSDQGDLTGALHDADQGVAMAPRFAYAWLARGGVRAAAGDLDGALRDYEQAAVIAPDDPTSWNRRGALFQRRGDLVAAVQAFDRALQLRPDYVESLLGRAITRQQQGDRRAALQDLDRVVALEPGSAKAWNSRAIVRGEAGDTEGALADMNRAIELAPTDELMLNRASLLRQRHDPAGAVRDCDQVLAHDPRHPYALVERGLAREEQGDRVGAGEDFRAALDGLPREDPLTERVRGWVRQLEGR